MIGVFVQVNADSHMSASQPIGYVIQENGCWEWVGRLDAKGYGHWRVSGRNQRAHRVLFEIENGPITPGLVLDHLCRNRACVNPAHVEVVTHRTNILRGAGSPAKNARKTHCANGHPFSPDNTRVEQIGDNLRRRCVVCDQRIQAGRPKKSRHLSRACDTRPA